MSNPRIMKINLLSLIGLLICSSAFSQNYISGTVSLYGPNAGGGSTTVAQGASMLFNNSTFYEQAGFINLGDSIAISADTATLALNGAGTQTVTGRFKLGAFSIYNAASTSVVSGSVPTMVTILDSVSFESVNGATLTANGLLTLRSTAFKTARLADITKNNTQSGNTVSGDVIVERFVPSKRAWRLMGPPTTGGGQSSQTIHDAWQEGGAQWTFGSQGSSAINPKPGYGTIVTKPDKAVASGYDDGVRNSTNYSLRTFSATGKLSQPPNTDATPLYDTLAYFLFVRGDRSILPEDQSSTTTASNNTNLRSRGPLRIGTIINTVRNTNGNFAGISNPYACTVDFSQLSRSGLKNGYYVWDPAIGTLGAWVYIDASNYSALPSGGSYGSPITNRYIESGQGILVATSNNTVGSTGSLTFTETAKNAFNTASVFREVNDEGSIMLNVYRENAGSPIFMDGAGVYFSEAFSNIVGDEDILKPNNITENVAFYDGGKYLLKDNRNLPVPDDTLSLQLWKTTKQKYHFAIQVANLPTTVHPYLADRYLNTLTDISNADTTEYNFDINNDSVSAAIDRFSIVFKEASILPITSAFLTAKLQDGGVALAWTVLNEKNMQSYVVEKSTDGANFSIAGTVSASTGSHANSAYNLFDATPALGTNYYRVKMISSDGSYSYTMVAEVNVTSAGMMMIAVSPNPVRDGKINVRFTNVPEGKYAVVVFNGEGKTVVTKEVQHAGGSAAYQLPGKSLAGGLYEVNIRNSNTGFVQTIKIAVMQ